MKLKIAGMVVDPNGSINNWDAIELEKQTGLTIKTYGEGLKVGSPLAYTAMVWLARREKEPNLSIRQVSFDLTDIDNVDDDGTVLKPAVDDDGKPVLDAENDQLLRRVDNGELVSPKGRVVLPSESDD